MVQYFEPLSRTLRWPATRRTARGLWVALLVLVLAASCAKRSECRRSHGEKRTGDSLRGDKLLAGRSGAVGPSRLAPDRGKTPPLKVLSAALTTIDEKYVAPDRIHPAKMFDKALEFLEAERAELRITGSAKERSVLVRVGARSRRFDVGTMSSIALLSAET